MRRKIVIVFLIWLCVCVIPGLLFFHYYFGFSLDMELFRMIVLASFLCLNFLYLVFRLMKIDIAFAMIIATLFSFAGTIYMQLYKDTDMLTQFLQMEFVLVVITIILHFVLKKRSSQD
ncbi:MAG: hypothetical protein DMF68_06680 [Acidobacteria bacterium]|nr:MAG: hypothetical protein DMF68_06680 [Acidobacteriota bacterium]